MTAKEKAKELVEKFMPLFGYWDYYNDEMRNQEHILNDAKRHALICVDEILRNCIKDIADLHYWSKVKQEIDNL